MKLRPALRRRLTAPLVALVFGVSCGRTYFMTVSHPIAHPISRACAGAALATDSAYRPLDTIARLWAITQERLTIGGFALRTLDDATLRYGRLWQSSVANGDTVVAEAYWPTPPTSAQIAFARGQLSTRINTIAIVSGNSTETSACRYFHNTGKPVSCADAIR